MCNMYSFPLSLSLSLKITGSKPNTTPASVRTGSHSSVNAAGGGGGNGLVTPVKDLFGVKETKQNSLHSGERERGREGGRVSIKKAQI